MISFRYSPWPRCTGQIRTHLEAGLKGAGGITWDRGERWSTRKTGRR